MGRFIQVFMGLLVFSSPALAGQRCEVLEFSTYESPGLEKRGGFFFQAVEKCVEATVMNRDWRARWATDFDVTVTFENGEKRSERVSGEKDRFVRLEPGGKHTANLCFGPSGHGIIGADCDYP